MNSYTLTAYTLSLGSRLKVKFEMRKYRNVFISIIDILTPTQPFEYVSKFTTKSGMECLLGDHQRMTKYDYRDQVAQGQQWEGHPNDQDYSS